MAKKSSGKGRRKKAPRGAATRQKAAPRSASAEPDADESVAADAEGIEPADLSALEDGKLYYRIGEVSQITGVKPYVLRYWESEFRLMAPQKSRSKQRLYRQKDIETVLAIKHLLYEERYTIAGARKRLREMGNEARALLVARIRNGEPAPRSADLAPEAANSADAASASVLASYRHLRDELLQLRALLAAGA